MKNDENPLYQEDVEKTVAPGWNYYRNPGNSSGYLPDAYLLPFSQESRLVIVEQKEITSGKQ